MNIGRRWAALFRTSLAYVLVSTVPYGCFHHPPSQPQLGAEWTAVSADSAALASLVARTRQEAGPELLRSVLNTASDSTRPTAVRLHALSAIPSYLIPGSEWGIMELLLDTARYRRRLPSSISHPDYTASSSIEPILRDSVRLAVRALARSPQDSIVGLAARNLSRVIGPPLPERLARVECTGPVRDDDWDDWYRLKAFVPLRSCPELLTDLWLRTGTDSTALAGLYEGTQHLRDRRLPPVLSDVATDGSRPLETRWAALQAMATLAHPRMYTMSFRSLDAFGDAWCTPWGWYAHHAVQEEGPRPLGPEGRGTILRLLEDQAETNPEERLRLGARRLHQCVLQLLEEHPSPAR